MRILHATDFHFRRHWFDWLAVQASSYDVCCLTGDLLDMFPSAKENLHAQSRWVRDWLHAWPARTPIFLCTGNHDWWLKSEHVTDNDAEGGWLRKARRPGVVFVDGDAAAIGGHRFCCWHWGSAPSVEPFDEPVVMLVHAPPQGTPLAADCGRDVGDADVTAAAWRLPRGSLVLSGHIHSPSKVWFRVGDTWCLNPGVDADASAPNYIAIDTVEREARFHGWGRELGPLCLQ
jgi:uncharacterized protein